MKLLQTVIIALISLTLVQCKNSQATTQSDKSGKVILEPNPEITVTKPYFQKWSAGQESSGSGYTLYFPNLINRNNYKLENVYFRGLIGEIKIGKALYFSKLNSKKPDVIMSGNTNKEYGNTLPNKTKVFPFTLKSNECVISYRANKEIKYFKIENLTEKPGEFFPSAPPKH